MSDEKPKYKQGAHPNSRRNLKPVAPGEGRNSRGGGRKKGSRNRSTVVAELLDLIANSDSMLLKNIRKNLPPEEAGKRRTFQEAMILGQILSAIAGNTSAFNALMDSRYGKVADKHELTGEDGEPIQMQMTRVILPVMDTNDDSESRGTEGG